MVADISGEGFFCSGPDQCKKPSHAGRLSFFGYCSMMEVIKKNKLPLKTDRFRRRGE
jgi:hypothetical protein